ncbi:MAG: hypothetical protein GYA23_04750 [Methanomicrobiales archaeon]|nr:hypothetical protein [Methanomicrobiales archaeon]
MAEQESGADCVSREWCDLAWTNWYPFSLASDRITSLPDGPGLYRIRAAGSPHLMYIGQTDQSLRRTFSEIRQATARSQMPWSDPHPVCPALWAWKDAKGFTYEFSAFLMDDSHARRMAGLYFLLYCYRQEVRDSPSCNFGRFHRKYRCTSTEREGIPGGLLGAQDPKNPAGGPSASPLPPTGVPGDANWMGLSWSPRRELKAHTTSAAPQAQGIFLLFDGGAGPLLAVSHAGTCSQALFELSKNPPVTKPLSYMFCCEAKPVAEHNLLERECDLIGNYAELYHEAPALQFMEE